MTEYDFSPEAYNRHLASQHRVSNWVSHTEDHRPAFGNAFKVLPPGASASAPPTPPLPDPVLPGHSVSARHLPTDPRVLQHQQQPQYYYPHLQTESQPQSRSSSRHRTHRSKKKQSSSAYIVAVPPATNAPAYVYAPSGWVPSAGLVILPSKGSKTSIVYSPPGTQYAYPPPPPQLQHAYTSPTNTYPYTSPPNSTLTSPQSFAYPGPYAFPQPVTFPQPQPPAQMYSAPLGQAMYQPVIPIMESGKKSKKRDKGLKKSKSEVWR
ncbi:hypothetical protein Hypma_004412 [Hypsizygus marmoreus]|uniref:Uncharacterized protein n=1 Tax=Hypsizygus marmoreus TaxID=39966 RepID=A0A369JXX4_HYPMA|nr:hypothetical protein Hypma_004412 [Hypsizygus marmoreus]